MSFQLISTTTVGSGGAASIDFTSIPGTYTDLFILLSTRDTQTGDGAGQYYKIKFNGGSTVATTRYLQGNGGSASSGTLNELGGISDHASSTANTFANNSIYIPNYAGSTAKSFSVDSVTEQNATSAYQTLIAGLWNVTSAITSISLVPATGNFVQYSTASLYGIKSGSGGATVS